MAKHSINTNEEDLDFALIGIVCPENQYRLLSLMNDVLLISLHLNDYIPYNLKSGKIFKFSLFHFEDPLSGLEYFFVPNSSNFEETKTNTSETNDLFSDHEVDESMKLVKELPNTDYFLILRGEGANHHQYKVMDKLKTVPEIIRIQSIEPKELPSRRNLIF